MANQMIKRSAILGFFICLWGAGALLHAQTPTRWQKHFNSLEIGMSAGKVQTLLGMPDLRDANDQLEIWHYQKDSRYVELKQKKVSAFGVGSPHLPMIQAHGVPAEAASPAPDAKVLTLPP